ncbi:MAG: hypothetical protein Unbinned3325contig1000_21 [Prokaryotic dsDNA virus sp.]|nr:MAG: hypothetical protein Unbinned3325contig1000_21 [Prokaryotic dsDNA virus sp.]|tara:strand:- start:11488 stop:11649 length:162 start_codon:yes stop_codon:yes gene_type:complete
MKIFDKKPTTPEITQGKFRVEFPDSMTTEKIEEIRTMVVKLLEMNNCKVVPVD